MYDGWKIINLFRSQTKTSKEIENQFFEVFCIANISKKLFIYVILFIKTN